MRNLLTLTFALLLVGVVGAAAQAAQNPAAPVQAGTGVGPAFVDANGDGICDTYEAGTRQGRAGTARGGNGPADGTGNRGIGPRDGTGFGAGSGAGGGVHDGSGPNGAGRGRGARR